MLTVYLGTKIWIFKNFVKSNRSISNLAKISLLWMVSHHWFCRCWVNINHYLAICSIRCFFTPVVGLFWIIRRFQDQFWLNKIQNIFDRSLFFGSSSFCLFFWKMFVIRTLLMITSGYFYPLVFAMGCQLKKYQIPFTQKRQKGVKQLSSKPLQTISVCSTWSPWLRGLVHWETWGKEKGKKLSSTSRRRWIQYVTLKPTCPVYWIIFFARNVWTISWRTINIIKNQKCQKWGTLNFVRVVMH